VGPGPPTHPAIPGWYEAVPYGQNAGVGTLAVVLLTVVLSTGWGVPRSVAPPVGPVLPKTHQTPNSLYLLPTYLPAGMLVHDRQGPTDDGEGRTMTRLIYVAGAGCTGGKEFKVWVWEPQGQAAENDRNKPWTVSPSTEECGPSGAGSDATLIDWSDSDGRAVRVYGVGPKDEVERFADGLRNATRRQWEQATAPKGPEPPPCRPADITMGERTSDGATTHWIVGYEVRNVGRSACLVSGTARLDLFDAQGRPLLVNQSSKAMMMRGKMPAGRIRLAPGTRGFVGVAGSHCDRNQPTAQTAQFTMPDEVRPIVVPTELELCPDGMVGVSPVRADAQDIYE